MKNSTKSLLIGLVLLFILLPNGIFAQQITMMKNQDNHLIFQSDTDTDNDGISDSIDQCPNDPETVNGFEDSDGCPDIVPSNDTDNDGISDSIDQCPTQPETVNGFEDLDGCPDILPVKDTDNDGISDSIDQCPTQPETVNGFEDLDGCPDLVSVDESNSKSKDDNSILQWTAIIAAGITAAGAIGAAKFRKHT